MELKFDFYIENESGERLNLLCDPFNLEEDLKFGFNEKFNKYATNNYIHSYFEQLLSEQTIPLDGTCYEQLKLQNMINYFSQNNIMNNPQEFTLYYKLFDVVYYTKVKVLNFEYVPKGTEKDSYYELSLTLDKLSDWVSDTVIKLLNAGERELSNAQKYPLQYDKNNPSVKTLLPTYGGNLITTYYNPIKFNLTSHKASPFLITVKDANNLRWKYTHNNNEVFTGLLNGSYMGNVSIDTREATQGIYYKGEDIRNMRGYELDDNFFYFGIGSGLLEITGATQILSVIIFQSFKIPGGVIVE